MKKIGAIATGLAGEMLEAQGAQSIQLTDYFTQTVLAIADTAKRHDPDADYRAFPLSFMKAAADGTAPEAAIAQSLISEAMEAPAEIEGIEIRGEEERALIEVLNEWNETLGRRVPEKVSYRDGNAMSCMRLSF